MLLVLVLIDLTYNFSDSNAVIDVFSITVEFLLVRGLLSIYESVHCLFHTVVLGSFGTDHFKHCCIFTLSDVDSVVRRDWG